MPVLLSFLAQLDAIEPDFKISKVPLPGLSELTRVAHARAALFSTKAALGSLKAVSLTLRSFAEEK